MVQEVLQSPTPSRLPLGRMWAFSCKCPQGWPESLEDLMVFPHWGHVYPSAIASLCGGDDSLGLLQLLSALDGICLILGPPLGHLRVGLGE